MLQNLLPLADDILVVAFGVFLGIALFFIVHNMVRHDKTVTRTPFRKSDQDKINQTSSLVQELYDEFIGNGGNSCQ